MKNNQWNVIFLALGTNLGDRAANLKSAREALPPLVKILVCSPVYETPPWGYADQPPFLNQVLKAQTQLSPRKLLSYIKRIEVKMGRVKTIRYGPRLIDIDILYYDDLILETRTLTIPHPRMAGRAFVWLPLADIAPDLRHPVLGRTSQEMLAELDTTGIVKYMDGCGGSSSYA